jgi:hypothetical protein
LRFEGGNVSARNQVLDDDEYLDDDGAEIYLLRLT